MLRHLPRMPTARGEKSAARIAPAANRAGTMPAGSRFRTDKKARLSIWARNVFVPKKMVKTAKLNFKPDQRERRMTSARTALLSKATNGKALADTDASSADNCGIGRSRMAMFIAKRKLSA